ncbi:MAG: ATP-binding cassette domain-containing protein [Bacteroidota bacterium]
MIELQNVVPRPLQSLGIRPDSTVFNTRCQFQAGKDHLILAPSGKGKSTLLHILYGLRKDWDGDVLWDGRSIRNWSSAEWTTVRSGRCTMVYQDLRLFPEQSAFDNIRINRDLAPHWDDHQIEEHAQTLGIDHLLGAKAGTLSYGQRQRVAILRALSQTFNWLFLDEPFSHLDAENTELALQLIRATVREQEAALLLVSLGEDYGLQDAERFIL